MSGIFNISEAASIAIHSMVAIAGSGGMLNVQQVSELTGYSKNHTAKVLQQLAKNHFLLSTRGPGGGFRMGKKAGEISLMDIYRLVEGEPESSRCGFDCDHCPARACIFGGLDKRFNEEFLSYMRNTSLARLLAPAAREKNSWSPKTGQDNKTREPMLQA